VSDHHRPTDEPVSHWIVRRRIPCGASAGGKTIALSPRLFLFDIDGTILRGGTAVHRDAFAHAFRAVYGVGLSLDGVVAAGRTDMWLLVEPLRRSGVPDEEIWAQMPRAFAIMEEYVDQHITDLRGSVLPGVPEVLAGLHARGCLLGLLTGNLSSIAHAKMRHAGLAQYFSTGAFGQESLDRADLVPVALAHAAATFGLSVLAGEGVLIGDTPLDVAAGQTHGTRTCAVATGRFSIETLRATGADLVLESLSDHERTIEALLRIGG
jgi:phosphoglycolate phosphatase